MMGIVLVLTLFGGLFAADNKEFFDQVAKERAMGAEWHLSLIHI